VAATIMGLLGLTRAAGTEDPALAGVAEVLPARNYGPRAARLMVPADSGPAVRSAPRVRTFAGARSEPAPTARTPVPRPLNGLVGPDRISGLHIDSLCWTFVEQYLPARAR
jgi:hypothetical protein